MPPIPAGCSMTRVLSVMANWPRRKKPSRGVVAIQFGLPRPAFRKADCELFEISLASLISSSLISKGLKVSKLWRFASSMFFSSSFVRSRLCEKQDQDHAPDGEEGISNGVRHGVAESGDLTLSHVAHQTERR